MVQCKKYPVSESASLDPLAPIHIFQHQFPGKSEIFSPIFRFFIKILNHLMGIFTYFMVVGWAAWAEKWRKVKSVVYMTENVWLLKPKLENQFLQVQTRLTQIRTRHEFLGNGLLEYFFLWSTYQNPSLWWMYCEMTDVVNFSES